MHIAIPVLRSPMFSKAKYGRRSETIAEKLYTAGQMFLETPNQVHAVSRNASTTKPARLLAVMLAEKGKQLTTPA